MSQAQETVPLSFNHSCSRESDNPSDILNKTSPPAFKIGTSSRGQDKGDRFNAPGPGSYHKNGETDPDKTRAPTIKFGSEERRPFSANFQTPGAGSCIFDGVFAD